MQDQKIAVAVAGCMIFATVGTSMAQDGVSPGTTRIAAWKDDKKTAFLIMLDDSVPSDFQVALPELLKRKMTATYYINPGTAHYERFKDKWEKELPAIPGVVYGNHTMTHQGLADFAGADADFAQGNAVITKAFPGKEPRLISFAKPGVGKEKWTITPEDYAKALAKHNLVAREPATGLNAAQFNNLTTVEGMLQIVDQGIQKGHIRSILFHGVGGDWLSTPADVFATFLDGLDARRDSVWITDHISAYKYQTEVKTAKVSVVEATEKAIRLELKDEADSQLYDMPLTLVTQIPTSWKHAQVVQGSAKTLATPVNGQLQFDALPDGPAIVLTQSATGPAVPVARPVSPLATATVPVAGTPPAQVPPAAAGTSVTIADADSTSGWDGVALVPDAKVGAGAVQIPVPAGKAGGAAYSLRKANLDFSKGGTIRFWYRLTGEGQTDLMFKIVAPTFNDNFQTVWTVFPAQKADGQWHQATVSLASGFQNWGTAPETGSNYLYFRTNAAAGSNLKLDLDQVEFAPGTAPVSVAALPAAPPARRGPRVEPPAAARVKEIAAALDATPRGLGFTLDNRAPWEALAANTAQSALLITRAEKFLNEPIPEVSEALYTASIASGSRDINAPIDRRRFRLVHFILAEGIENKGRFLPAIEKELLAICSESNWMIAAHVKFSGSNDLGSAMTGWTLATAVSMLGDRLSETTRNTVKENVERRVIRPYLAQMRNIDATADFWRYDANNWNAVVHGGITGAALALTDSVQDRAEIVAAAEKDTQRYIAGFPQDGYSTEGMGYWKYGFGHYVMLAEAVLAATKGKVNLFYAGNARQVAQFPRRFEVVPGVYPAYSDSPFKEDTTPWLSHVIDRRYGLGDIAPRSWEMGGMFSTFLYAWSINLAFNPNSTAPPAADASVVKGHRIRDWFDVSQIYVGRPPVAQQGLSLSFKGGNNGTSHSHNDLGSYLVVTGKQPLLVDAGSTVYNAATFGAQRYENVVINSYGHAVPRVAGQLQGQGSKYFATVAGTKFSDATDSVTLDLTKGYEVPALRQLLRTFAYTRTGPGSVAVTDSVEFTSPQTFGTALITLGEAREEKPGVWIISQGDSSVRATMDAGGAPFTVTNEVLKDAAAAGKVRRLGIELDAPVAQAKIAVTITPVQ